MNPCPQDSLPISQSDRAGRPTITLQQNVPQSITIQFVDNYGNHIQLVDGSTLPSPASNPNPGSSPFIVVFHDATAVAGGSARILMTRHPVERQTVEVVGTYTSDGAFTFAFPAGAVAMPGLFLGTIIVMDVNGVNLLAKNCYISIEQNSTDSFYRNGPLDIVEVRMSLRDFENANTLLEDVEFSDREIAHCIRKPVDWWNESLPPIGGYDYTSFPFRLNWLNGTIASLLKLAAHWYRRNKLSVSAAGVQVNYLDKAQEYQQLGDQMWKEYVEWCQSKKVSINLESGWGSVPGAWAR